MSPDDLATDELLYSLFLIGNVTLLYDEAKRARARVQELEAENRAMQMSLISYHARFGVS